MMIQSIMLVALGFLLASLVALVFARATWKRAVRLTTERIKASMPLSEQEINAEKDQLRAEYAIQIRQFELQLEKATQKTANQFIQINKREAEINDLKMKVEEVTRQLSEQKNANLVYKQTIVNRLPKMEAQLNKAKEMLGERYQEITKLKTTIDMQKGKLGEAQAKDQVRAAELKRLKLALNQTAEVTQVNEQDLIPFKDFDALKERNLELEGEITELKALLENQRLNENEEAALLKYEMHDLADKILKISSAATQEKADTSQANGETSDTAQKKKKDTASASQTQSYGLSDRLKGVHSSRSS